MLNNISEKLNFNGKTALDSVELDYSAFDEEIIRIYLDSIYNIGIPEEKLDLKHLIKLIQWMIYEGKTGNYFIISKLFTLYESYSMTHTV